MSENTAPSVEPGTWERMVASNPQHPFNYAERFRQMAANGADLLGEARFVDTMAPREAHILDAGCGPGRHASWLAARGHRVVGVDLDPNLIEIARAEAPGPDYFVQNLALLDLPAQGVEEAFDVIMCAGNVIAFPAPSSRRPILERFAAHLKPEGRAVIGFGAGRGYEFNEFLNDAAHSGLELQLGLSTWDLKPFRTDTNFLVAIFGRAAA
ncbi:class I SAM-dependent methyltransferase [Luteococcus peritonei]|uniref:Class I SAM-dependent methyltransferase n=1 Tax=Luteococcus peritonei TaxID=88874 RepID=A0ABW4RSC7_9ACTN